MWSSSHHPRSRHRLATRRRLLALGLGLAAAPLLQACGFRPLYGGPAGEAVAAELAAVAVEAPRTRIGRILENQLIDDLNPSGLDVAKRYRLDVELRRTEKALAIQLDERVTRYDLTLAAFFALRPLGSASGTEAAPAAASADGMEPVGGEGVAALYRSAVRRVATYNVIREPFATLVAEQDAERRAAAEVSRDIRNLLTLYFQNDAGQAPG